MYKVIPIHIKIACLFFFVLFLSGCDSQTEPPQAPKAITKKIAVSAPAQSAPAKPPAQHAPAPEQLSVPTQPTPLTKPETASKAIQPDPTGEKSSPAQKTVTAQPVPAAAPIKAKQAADSVEKSEKGTSAPPPQDRVADSATDKPAPDVIVEAPKTAPTGDQASDAEPANLDLAKMSTDDTGGYRPTGRVDPFQPLFEEKPVIPGDTADAEKQKKKRRMPLTPLERVDLSQLKLVGIIQAPSGNKALVEEASGKGYIIKKGTFIGIHAGRVLEIQKDRVVVEEEVENVLGQFTLEQKELKLQKPPGEF